MNRLNYSPTELDLFHFWRPSVRVFQFLGISHYAILRPELSNQRNKLNLFRLFLLLTIAIQAAISVYYLLKVNLSVKTSTLEEYNVSPIFVYVNDGTKFIFISSFMLIPLEMLYNRRAECTIFETLHRIDDIFKNDLKHPIDYGVHRRRKMRQIWLYSAGMGIAVYSATAINYSAHSMTTLKAHISVLLFVYIFIVSRMRVFQIVLLISELIDLLNDLKTSMRRQQQRIKCNPARWREIQYSRKIYSNIWLLRTLIGECFGCSLITFVIDSAVKIISSAYWFYLNTSSTKSNALNIREFN